MNNILRIKKNSIPLVEQETIINIDYSNQLAYIYSCYSPEIKRLYKLAEKYPNNVSIVQDDKYGISISIPIKWIGIKTPRQVSEEQKQKMAARMKAINENKRGNNT